VSDEPPPPPLVSPDGRFYWDGDRWIPLPQQAPDLAQPHATDALGPIQESPSPLRARPELEGTTADQSAIGERVLAQTRERLGCVSWFWIILLLGLPLIWWAKRIYILTDQQVIMKRGVVFRTVKTIPLSKVQDVQVTQGPLGAYVQLSSAGGAYGVMVFGQLPKTAAAEFVAALELARKGT
jgi:hypothetical protein